MDLWGLKSNDKTTDNKFLGVLSELETGINQLLNVDFGADYKYLSENSWKQGKYFQSVIYNIDGLIESAIDVVLVPTAAVTSKIDSFCQNNLGLGLDEMAITLQANGLTAVAGQTLYYATQWAKSSAAMSGSKTVITATNIGCDIVTQGASFVGVDNNIIQVTNEGVALSPGIKIPKDLIENPYRSGSYGVILDGKFKETLRIDPPTPTGKKGPEYSHFHINGDKEHLTDISKWPE